MTDKSLISAAELMDAIKSREELILIGIMPSWRFIIRHIPGSYQICRHELWEKGSSQLLNAESFTSWAQQLGIHKNSKVIIWDDRYDATWLWWAFKHYSKRNVCILHGGLQAWRKAGFQLARGPGKTKCNQRTGDFIARTSGEFPIATLDQVLQTEMVNNAQLWDTRDLEEWLGHKRLKGSPRAGRIPWSRHLPWQAFRKQGRKSSSFRTDAEISQVIQAHRIDPSKTQIFYCQSGVRTTTIIYALYRLGWDPRLLHNYCGSWREWSNQAELPASQHQQVREGRLRHAIARIKQLFQNKTKRRSV